MSNRSKSLKIHPMNTPKQTKGFSVYQELKPGYFECFYWAPEKKEAYTHAECIRAIFPRLNIVVHGD